MKAQINQSILAKTIELAMLAISPKPPTPVIGCVIIKSDDDRLTIKTTNTAFSIYQIIEADVSESGCVAVPARIFKDAIASFTGELNLELNDNYLAIAHETGQCRLSNNGNIDEFPDIEEAAKGEKYCTIAISTKKLEVAINGVLYAASSDETKMILTGVNFDINNDKLVIITTDGHRVARTSNTLDDWDSGNFNFTIPVKTLIELSKILQKSPENSNCTFDVYESVVVMTIPGIKIISRLLAGQYPAVEELIPSEFKSKFILERRAFLATLKRVLNLADKNRSLAIAWNVGEQTATLYTQSDDFGDACDSIKINPQTKESNNFQIGFNIDYLSNAINSITTDEIVIKCNDSPQPVVVCPIGGLFDQLALVMPLQINSTWPGKDTAKAIKTIKATTEPVEPTDITTEVTAVTETSGFVDVTTEVTEIIDINSVTDDTTTLVTPPSTTPKASRSKKTTKVG